MVHITHSIISKIDTETLLAELAYRTENFSKYQLLEGKFNSFRDYDGQEWAVKLENRTKCSIQAI
jgi:hypothetical protein